MEAVAVDSVAAAAASAFTVRTMRQDDVEAAGKAYYTAFYVDSLATGVPLSFQTASPETASRQLQSLVDLPEAYNVVAVDGKGKLLGGAWDTYAHAIGPVFVSPDESHRGIGKALERALVAHAQKLNAPSICVITSAANRMSFRLYVSLGFRPVACTSAFFGTVPLDAVEMAAAAVGISTDGIDSRKMEEADIKACAEIFSKGMGYAREKNIRVRLSIEPERCWVATTDDTTILGYTTGLSGAGHTVTTSEAAWVAVVLRAIRERDGEVSSLSIPGVLYPRLIQWALAAKLVLARHSWYMVLGKYQAPNDGFYWSPSGHY